VTKGLVLVGFNAISHSHRGFSNVFPGVDE